MPMRRSDRSFLVYEVLPHLTELKKWHELLDQVEVLKTGKPVTRRSTKLVQGVWDSVVFKLYREGVSSEDGDPYAFVTRSMVLDAATRCEHPETFAIQKVNKGGRKVPGLRCAQCSEEVDPGPEARIVMDITSEDYVESFALDTSEVEYDEKGEPIKGN